MDISKYFRESLGVRDNESRLYILSEGATDKFVLPSFCNGGYSDKKEFTPI